MQWQRVAVNIHYQECEYNGGHWRLSFSEVSVKVETMDQ